jgi:hypothetical protein
MLAGSVYVSVGFRDDAYGLPRGAFWTPAAGHGGTLYTVLDEPASDSFSLVGAATELLRELWHEEKVNFLAVTLTNLMPPSNQPRLFLNESCHPGQAKARLTGRSASRDPEKNQAASGLFLDSSLRWNDGQDRKRQASRAADLIRDRYGDEAIMFGHMLGLGDEAPDRIGFRKVEGVEI